MADEDDRCLVEGRLVDARQATGQWEGLERMPDQGNVPDVNILVIVSLAIAALVIAGAIALGARRARLGIFLLSALAILTLGVADALARQAALATFPDLFRAPPYPVDVAMIMAGHAATVLAGIAPFAVGAAWVLGLLVTARGRQWGWLAAIALVVLISALLYLYLFVRFVRPPQEGLDSLAVCVPDSGVCVRSLRLGRQTTGILHPPARDAAGDTGLWHRWAAGEAGRVSAPAHGIDVEPIPCFHLFRIRTRSS